MFDYVDPMEVLVTALGGFWGSDWGEQPPKKSPGPIGVTVLDPKMVPKGSPKGPIL